MTATPMMAATTTQTAMAMGTTGSLKPLSSSDRDCSGVAVSAGDWVEAVGAGVAWVSFSGVAVAS